MRPLSKNANIAVGAAMFIIGVIITALSGGGVIYIGLIVIGLWRLVQGLLMQGDTPSNLSFEEQLEREGPSRGRQVVGASCIQCDKKVFADSDASVCDACDEVVHLDCAKKHRKAKHPKKAARAEA